LLANTTDPTEIAEIMDEMKQLEQEAPSEFFEDDY